MRRSLIVLLSLALVAGAGCVSVFTDPLGREEALKMTQREYTNMIRWGKIEDAAELVDPEMREEFLAFLPAFEELRITDFEIGKLSYVPRPDDDEEAQDQGSVTVTYRGYSLRTLTEQKVREKQEWYRVNGVSNQWMVRPQIAGIANAFRTESR